MGRMLDTVLGAALALADLDYRVFPCRPGAKNPLTEHGVLDATTDHETIERWWALWPNANVALATDGLLVIDVDGADNPWLRDQPERLLDMAAAPLSLTANGGRQYFFRQPAGANFRNTAGRVAPCVDKVSGNLLVHPASVVGIGPLRQWVLDHVDDPCVVMVDDDVTHVYSQVGFPRTTCDNFPDITLTP